MSMEDDQSWRTHEVPTYTQAEDSWILGLSLKQLLGIIVVGGFGYGIFQFAGLEFLPFLARIAVVGVFCAVGVLSVVIRPDGRSLFMILSEIVRYFIEKKEYGEPLMDLVSSESAEEVMARELEEAVESGEVAMVERGFFERLREDGLGAAFRGDDYGEYKSWEGEGRGGDDVSRAVAVALVVGLGSLLTLSVACGGSVSAQSGWEGIRYYPGERVFLQSIVIDRSKATGDEPIYEYDPSGVLRAGTSMVSEYAYVRLKVAAPLREIRPSVNTSVHTIDRYASEQARSGSGLPPNCRITRGQEILGYYFVDGGSLPWNCQRGLASGGDGVLLGQEVAFNAIMLAQPPARDCWVGVTESSPYVHLSMVYSSRGEQGVFEAAQGMKKWGMYKRDRCRLDLRRGKSSALGGWVNPVHASEKPSLVLNWVDRLQNAGVLFIGGHLQPSHQGFLWEVGKLQKERNLPMGNVVYGDDAKNTFVVDDSTFCALNMIRLLSIGVQTERPDNVVGYGENLRTPGDLGDYFEGGSGRQVAGMVQVCPLGNRHAPVGHKAVYQGGNMQVVVNETPIVEANREQDEAFNILVASMLETTRPEDVDTRAIVEIFVKVRDSTTNQVYGPREVLRKVDGDIVVSPRYSEAGLEYPVIKFVLDANDWRRRDLFEVKGSKADGKILYPAHLDVAKLFIKITLQHGVTVSPPDKQMIGFCRRFFEELPEGCSMGSCRATASGCSGDGCEVLFHEVTHWQPHHRASLSRAGDREETCRGGERVYGSDEENKMRFGYTREVWLEPIFVAFAPLYEPWRKVNTDFYLEDGVNPARLGVKHDGSVVPRRGDGGSVLRVGAGEDLPNRPGVACSAASANAENGWTWNAPVTFPSGNDILRERISYSGYCQMDYLPRDSSIGTEHICIDDPTRLPGGWLYVRPFEAVVNGETVTTGGGCRPDPHCCVDTPEVEWGRPGSCSQSPPTAEEYSCPYPEPTPTVEPDG